MNRIHYVSRCIAACLLFALTACGGGVAVPVTSGGTPLFDCTGATEFDWSITSGGTTYCSYGPGTIGADAAYAKGATGGGALVAVIDTGIDPTHSELDAQISPDSIDIVRGDPLTDEDGHGTHVSGIIAAENNGAANHGVAYDATILAIRADTRITNLAICGDLNPCSVFTDADITAALDYAALKGADVINLSLGGATPMDAASEQALIDAMAAGAIVVAAAGNESTSFSPALEPIWPAAYAGDATVNASGQMIAVGAVDDTGALAEFSNYCGSAMDFCLVAPGVDILSDYPGDLVAVISGTSQATPFVSGAAALLVGNWPALTAAEVVQILLTTATDLGAAGVDAVYGHGLLNLSAAVAPLGTLDIPMTGLASGSTVALGGTALSLGPAFGDALSTSSLLSQAFALDDYDRNYSVDLNDFIGHAPRGFGLVALLGSGSIESVDAVLPNGMKIAMGVSDEEDSASAADWAGMAAGDGETKKLRGMNLEIETGPGTSLSLGYDVTPEQQMAGLAASEPAGLFWMPGDMLGPQHGLVGAGTGVYLSRELGASSILSVGWVDEKDGDDVWGADAKIGEITLMHRFDNGAIAYTGYSAVDEQGSFLGSDGAGGFAVAGADTRFYELGVHYPLAGGFELIGSYTLGEADMQSDGTSLLGEWSEIRAEAFGVGLVKNGVLGRHDRIGLLAGQPLRVSSGEATVTAPVDYLADKTVVQGSERVSMTPTGREIDLQLAYDTPLGGGASVSGWLMMQLEPGHVAAADPAYGAGLRFSAEF